MMLSYAHQQIKITAKLLKMAVFGQTNKQTRHVPVTAEKVVGFMQMSQPNQTSHNKSKTIRRKCRLSSFG